MTTDQQLPRVTPSNVNDLECAKKFYNLHILKNRPPWQMSQSTQFGIGVHSILKNVYDPKNGVPPNLTHLEVYAKDAFYGFAYSESAARHNDILRSCHIVCGYVGNDDEEDAHGTIAVEQFGTFIIKRADEPLFEIAAKLDRIIVRENKPNELVIRDYKTSRPRPNLKESFVQAWVAKLIYPNYDSYVLETDCIDEDGRVERSTIHSSELKGILGLRQFKTLTTLPRTEFPAEPGEACAYCPLRLECQPTSPVAINVTDETFGF